MRQVVLDTETTGLAPEDGHRIIEIGAIELKDRRMTGHDFWTYLNPEREIDAGATDVHGLRSDDLAGKPRFAEIAESLLEFLAGDELIIHNAPFDLAFLNRELERSQARIRRVETYCSILDTLPLARRLHPGQNNSLEALCLRYAVDTSDRTRHGALIDARLLAQVYRAMTMGQGALGLQGPSASHPGPSQRATPRVSSTRRLIPVTLRPEDWAAHREFLRHIDQKSGGQLAWRTDLDPAT
ncbi:MAG: DNA polymerase III subunit epsilon [Gammaproteobacteria bacterium]